MWIQCSAWSMANSSFAFGTCWNFNFPPNIFTLQLVESVDAQLEDTESWLYRLYANITPFHIKDSSICGLWYPQGPWNHSPMETEGCDWICFRHSPIWLCEGLSREMKEMKAMNSILLGRVCDFPDCSGFLRKRLQAQRVSGPRLGAASPQPHQHLSHHTPSSIRSRVSHSAVNKAYPSRY